MKQVAALVAILVTTIPVVSSAALIAEQPDNSSARVISTTNQVRAHGPSFTASGTYSLGSFYSTNLAGDECAASTTGTLRFSANIQPGRSLTARIFHDTATPTPHGTDYLSWGDIATCTSYIPGNGVMTDYAMPTSLPVLGSNTSDSGILNGETYHVVFGEASGFNMDTEFKTDAAGNISYQLFDDATSTPATTTPDVLDPVIIIPGILGSQEHNGVWVIDPILHSYDDLIATLDANDYTLGVDLFTFPYDWRKSNVDTAILLKQKIDEVKALCQCSKVDLVAHSMGGLAARQYIQSAAYQQDVDQLIFLGTPHLGAPKAYLMWEGGEFGTTLDVKAFVIEKALSQEAHEKGYASLFEYLQNKPVTAVRELLPIYDYIFDGSNLRHYPNSYPGNTFLNGLQNTVNTLNQSGVQVTNIVGNIGSDSTITAISATTSTELPKWQDGYPIGYHDLLGSHGLELGAGDGTVPFASASAIQPPVSTLDVCHTSLPSFAKDKIFEVLTGKPAMLQSPSIDVCNARIAIFQILSPADIVVIAPDGKRIGKDFGTGQELNEISGAFYSGFGTDTEYVTVVNPQAGQYKFLTQGTGTGGEYTVQVSFKSEVNSTTASFSGVTSLGQITDHLVGITNDNVSIAPRDTVPPSIVFLNPATSTFLHSSIMPIMIKITDDSGVATTSIKLDGKSISASTTIDLFFQQLGTHMITVVAKDAVGNSTTTQRSFEIVATLESTKLDLSRIFSLGWVKKDLRDLIMAQLNKALVLQKITVVAKNGSKSTVLIQVIDKVLMQLIQKELQAAKAIGAINAQGYEILSKDISWLISHN